MRLHRIRSGHVDGRHVVRASMSPDDLTRAAATGHGSKLAASEETSPSPDACRYAMNPRFATGKRARLVKIVGSMPAGTPNQVASVAAY